MGNHESGAGLAFNAIPATFDTMKPLVRTLLVLAALAYGAMPFAGLATAMPYGAGAGADAIIESVVVAPAASGHAAHGHAMQPEARGNPRSVTADADCPHPGKTDRGPHCAACLTLPAELRTVACGPQPRAAEAPTVPAALSSRPAGPLDPPPRV